MSTLELPDVDLYYETMGDGPLLVLIPGANGDSSVFGPVSERLAQQFTVVTYDRRGYSRSEISGTGEDDDRLATDANDVRRLIDHLTDEQAFVFGTSSGAIVALTVLTNYPSVVHRLIAHEPPALELLPDSEHWGEFFRDVYETYEETGVGPAMQKFASRMANDADAEAMINRSGSSDSDTAAKNRIRWFEHEFNPVATHEADVDALAEHSDRLVPVRGRESEGTPPYRALTILAEQLGLDILDVPGGHLGYATNPSRFAQELVDGLAQRDAL